MIKAISAGIVFGLILSIFVIAFYPPSNDYSLQNQYWNGMSELREEISPVQLSGDQNLPLLFAAKPANSFVLLELGPTLPFSQQDIAAIESFIRQGGILIIADDFGSGNQLLQGLGLNIRFSGILLLDPLFNVKAEQLPVIEAKVRNISSIAFNYATYLNTTTSANISESTYPIKIIGYSSPFSFGDLKQAGTFVAGDPQGPLPVIAQVSYGNGKIIIISDSSLFLNSMIHYDDNNLFLNFLTSGKTPIVDTSHWVYSYQSQAASAIISAYGFIQNTGLKYGLVALAAVLIIFVDFKVRADEGDEEKDDELNALKNHPDWDRNELLQLINERKNESDSGY